MSPRRLNAVSHHSNAFHDRWPPASSREVELIAPLALCQRRIGLTTTTTTQTRDSFLPVRRLRQRTGRKEKMGGCRDRVVVSKRNFHWHRASGERSVP